MTIKRKISPKHIMSHKTKQNNRRVLGKRSINDFFFLYNNIAPNEAYFCTETGCLVKNSFNY